MEARTNVRTAGPNLGNTFSRPKGHWDVASGEAENVDVWYCDHLGMMVDSLRNKLVFVGNTKPQFRNHGSRFRLLYLCAHKCSGQRQEH